MYLREFCFFFLIMISVHFYLENWGMVITLALGTTLILQGKTLERNTLKLTEKISND